MTIKILSYISKTAFLKLSAYLCFYLMLIFYDPFMASSALGLHQGLNSYRHAHQWLKTTRRLKWLIIPLILATLLFPTYIYGVYSATTSSLAWLVNYFNWDAYSFGYWLSFPFVVVIVLLLGYIIVKNLIMLLCVPMNAYLADAMMDDTLGKPIQDIPLLKSIMRALVMTLFAIFIGLISTVILIAIGLIPIAGAIISLILGFIIQAFLAAWGFFDPVFERLHYPVSKSFWRCIRLMPQVQSQGLPFVLLFQIPILGWALAPTYGTLAGVWYASQLHQQQRLLPPTPTAGDYP